MKIILEYHMVDDISHDYTNIHIDPDNFEQQIYYLKKNCQIRSLEDLLNDSHNDGVQAAITFDDVFSGFKNYVYPILKKYHVPAKLFLTSQYSAVTREFWMNELARLLLDGKKYKSEFVFMFPMYQYVFPSTSYQERVELYHSLKFILGGLPKSVRETCMEQVRNWVYMDCGDRKEYMPLDINFCREIKDDSLISFGAHTDSHGILGEMTYEEQYEEISQCKSYLESELHTEIQHFAYPFGSYNSMTKQILKNLCFRSACSSRRGELNKNGIDNLLELPRIILPNVGEAGLARWMDMLCGKGGSDNSDEFIQYVGELKFDQTIYNEEKRCVIFGAGVFGEIVLRKMQALGMRAEFVGFADNDALKQGKIYLGYPVFGADSLVGEGYEIYIWHYSRSILEQLKELKVSKIHLITRV